MPKSSGISTSATRSMPPRTPLITTPTVAPMKSRCQSTAREPVAMAPKRSPGSPSKPWISPISA